MGRKNRNYFMQSAIGNNTQYLYYYNRIMQLALSRFEYHNLPTTMDERFLEMQLIERGSALLFVDDVMGPLCLPFSYGGPLDIYQKPTVRRAYASNGYNTERSELDSVIIYNSRMRQPDMQAIRLFAYRLWNFDRIIDINCNAQKTPIIIQCDESGRLTMTNLYKEVDGNSPVVYVNKNLDLPNSLKVINTQAPFIAENILNIKKSVWDECMSYLGITTAGIYKAERVTSSEANNSGGATVASRWSPLAERQAAIEKFNRMFGLNITVNMREDYDVYKTLLTGAPDAALEGGEPIE